MSVTPQEVIRPILRGDNREVVMESKEVLDFWFSKRVKAKWFDKDPSFDGEIKEKFGDALADAKEGKLDAWTEQPEGLLALVILLDQFSRNLFRDSAAAFEADGKALGLVKEALNKGWDSQLPKDSVNFLYMPLMHSEDLEDQERCVELFDAMEGEDSAKWAIMHRDIIARFGRFPHRNEILGRESTEEEIAFLKQPGSSF